MECIFACNEIFLGAAQRSACAKRLAAFKKFYFLGPPVGERTTVSSVGQEIDVKRETSRNNPTKVRRY